MRADEFRLPRRLTVPLCAWIALGVLGAYLGAQPDARALMEIFPALARVWAKNHPGPEAWGVMAHRHGTAALAAGLVLVAAWGSGRWLARWLSRRAGLHGVEGATVRCAVGLGGASLVMLGAGLCGLFGTGVWLVGAAGVAGLANVGKPARAVGRIRSAEGGGWVFLAAAAVLLLTDLVASAAPEWFTDGQTYHLALPARFLLTGKIPVLPENLLTFLPLNNEMAYGAVMAASHALGGPGIVAEEAAKLLNWALGAGVALAAALVALRLGAGRWGSAAAALLVAGMPLVMVENEIAFADNYRALLETCAVLLLLPRAGRPGAVALAAACAGFAMGSKYLSVIGMGALAGSLLALRGRLPWRFTLTAAAAVSPWLVRNALAGHDPVYPFLPAVFHPLRFSPAELARWMQDNAHYGVATMTPRSWLSLPWRLCVNPGEADFGTFGAGPLVLGLAPLLLLRRGMPRVVLALAGLCAVEGLAWSLTSHLSRYLLPALVLWCALLGWALGRLRVAAPRSAAIFTGILLFAAVPAFVSRAHHRCNLDDLDGVLGYALGRGNDAGARAARGFGPALDALPAGDVLFVGEDRTLGAGRRWRATSAYNRSLIKEWAEAAPDARRFAVRVRQGGRFAAVILNGEMFSASQARGPEFLLTARELAVVNPWWKALPVAWRVPPWTVYAVPRHLVK